jgi:hypothetical protein
MAHTIYVVFGESGERDDYASWMVKGFTNLAKAELYAIQCGAEPPLFNVPDPVDYNVYELIVEEDDE